MRTDVILVLTLAVLGYLKFMMDVYHGSFLISLSVLVASIGIGLCLGNRIGEITGADR